MSDEASKNISGASPPAPDTGKSKVDPKPKQVKAPPKKDEPYCALEEVFEELCKVDDDTPTSFCTGGGPIEEAYLPCNTTLSIEGIGPIPLPITEQYAKKIKAIAEQAPHGRGTETVVDTTVRNTLQIDASKVSFGDGGDSDWEDLIYDYVSADLGLDRSLVKIKPYKFLLYEPGGFFAKHRDTEKEDGMFGTLVIQLPSVFKGGKFIVTHNGDTKTFVQDDTQGFHYIAHYADCEHEIQPIESGHRLALVYSLCHNGNGTPPSADAVRYNALASKIRRFCQQRWATKILCHPLEHQYTIASLSSRGASALKGKDRNKFQVIQAACSAINMQVVISKLTREKIEHGDMGWDGQFWSDETEKFAPYIDKAYKADGSSLSERETKRLDKLLKGYDFESCETHGDLLADKDTAKAMWGDGESSLEITGNEGATRETFYDAYLVLMFQPEPSK